jgi:hypothetical protein
MDGFSWSLLLAALGIALTHTVLGPDHYLPFIMLARARGWSASRAVAVTVACGAGHVVTSILLGGLGVLLGVSVGRLEQLEAGRGTMAAWALVAFGLAYAAWGARRAFRSARGFEPHSHDGHVHLHTRGDRPHRHPAVPRSTASFWTLFAIFIVGPCEPLIPLVILPASRGRWELAALIAAVFGLVTVAAMVGMTLLGVLGLRRLPLAPLARWDHALAGGIIAASGLAIIFLGL